MVCIHETPFTTVVHDERLQLPRHSSTAQGRSLATLQILQALVEPGCSDLAALSLQAMAHHLETLKSEFGANTLVESVIQELVQREQCSALQARVPRGLGGEERLA